MLLYNYGVLKIINNLLKYFYDKKFGIKKDFMIENDKEIFGKSEQKKYEENMKIVDEVIGKMYNKLETRIGTKFHAFLFANM